MTIPKLPNNRIYISSCQNLYPKLQVYFDYDQYPDEVLLKTNNSYNPIALRCEYKNDYVEIAIWEDPNNSLILRLPYSECSCMPNFIGYDYL